MCGTWSPNQELFLQVQTTAISYNSWIEVFPCNMATLYMCPVPGRQWRLRGCSQDLCLLWCPRLAVPWEGMRGWMKEHSAPSFVLQKGWEGHCGQSCRLSGEKELLSVRAAELPRERAYHCLCPSLPSREPPGWLAGWHFPSCSLHVPHFPGALLGVGVCRDLGQRWEEA